MMLNLAVIVSKPTPKKRGSNSKKLICSLVVKE